MCALFAAVAAFTTPPSELRATALRGVLSTFERAAEVPFKVFGKESGAGQLLKRLRKGPRGDAVAAGARPAPAPNAPNAKLPAWLAAAGPSLERPAVESVAPVKAASIDVELCARDGPRGTRRGSPPRARASSASTRATCRRSAAAPPALSLIHI